MTRALRKLWTDSGGAAALEFAFAVPALAMMIWGLFQIGMVYQANAGMQHALGEAARYATIYPTPTDTQLQTMITSHKFGLGRGTWSTPQIDNSVANQKTITVTYSQPMNFLLFNGPSVSITKSKVVYLSV